MGCLVYQTSKEDQNFKDYCTPLLCRGRQLPMIYTKVQNILSLLWILGQHKSISPSQ